MVLANSKSRNKRDAGQETLLAHTDFSSVVSQIKDYAIFVIDTEGRVASWNLGAERLKGYRANEIIGRHFSRFYTPEDNIADLPAIGLRLARQDGRFEREGWRVRKDGSRFWANCILTAVVGENREIRGFVKVTHDLTERRRAQEKLARSEEHYRMLVEAMQDYAIFRLDQRAQIVSWNTGAMRISGYETEDVIGRPFSLLYTPEDIAAGKPHRVVETALRKGHADDEGWRVRKDGSRFWAEVAIWPLCDGQGELVGFGVISKDLTERNAAQEERMMRHSAEAALREHDTFLSVASHEIRSPLSALKLYMQTTQEELLAGKFERVLEKLPARVSGVQRQVDRIASLVNRLTSASALKAGEIELNLSDVDLSELASAIIADIAEAARKVGSEINFKTAGAVVGRWSPQHLEDVIRNLIQNAIKFGAGKPILVTLDADEVNARLSVEDRGIGIPESDRERIFERFERGVDSRHYGGFGLGLWISRQITSALGGKLQVQSQPGEGATFTVTLPLVPPVAGRAYSKHLS